MLSCVLLVCRVLVFATTAMGVGPDNSWNEGNGKWENSNDWSLATPPSSNNQADLVTNAGNNTVTIDAITTNSPVTMTINNLLVSSTGPGTNTVSLSGAGFATPLHVVNQFGLSNNSAVVINNSAAQVDGILLVGLTDGAGNQLIVTNGGRLVSALTTVGGLPSFNDSVLVTGTNSTWVNTNDNLAVRNSSPGVGMVVANGGKFIGNGVFVGDTGSSSSNTVIVTGPGSSWTNLGALSIGGPNYGDQLVVSNGASLYTANAIIGYPSGHNHSAIVTGTNSLWKTDGPIQVGLGGSGDSLTITAGGMLIASNASHTAEVIVDGATLSLGDGTFTSDNLIVTNGGIVKYTSTYPVNNGTVTVASGTVQAGSNLTVASTANSTGTVNITGGQLVVTNGVLGIGNNGTITSGSGVGRVTVSNGMLVASSIVVGNTAGSQCDLILSDGGVISDGGCPSGTNCQIVINSLGFQQTNGTVQACASPMQLGVTGPADSAVSGDSANDSFQYLYAGYSNVGTFTLAGGAVNVCAQFIVGHLGLDVGSVIATGAVWVTGGQLTIDSDDSIVGNSGVGQMSISNGVVLAAKVTVGNSANPSSCGTLTLAGGTLTMNSLVLPNARSRFIFTGGCLNALGITNSNGQMLSLGNGVSSITLNLLGGISSIGTGLKIMTNVTLTGFGTITGNVVNYGLIVSGNGVLNFAGGVLTNYGTILTTPGGAMNFLGTVVNTGLILTNNGIHFLGGLVNNGLLLDPAADTDRDGISNLSEALAGTDPTKSASFFHIKTIATVGHDLQVSWSTVGGKTYVVQAAPVSAGGSTNSYTDISSTITAPGVGESMMSYTDLGGANGPPRFYRIRLGQ